MNPGNIPESKADKQSQTTAPGGEETGQDRPHTQTHGGSQESTQNAIDDAEGMSAKQAERDYDGAQSAQGRGFATHPSQMDKHNTVGESAAHAGNLSSLTSNSNNQGISNHAASEEAPGQEKVTSQRPDAQASINQNLKK